MSAIARIENVLKQEEEQILQTIEAHKTEIAKLPKGFIRKLQPKDSNEYFQLQYYCAEIKRSRFKHIGKDPAVVKAMEQQIDRRKELEREIKELNRELVTIDKMLKHTSKHLEVNSVLEALKTLETERDPSTPPPNNAQQERK